MQKHPMIPVKEAAVALRVEDRWIREMLKTGLMRGEKRKEGLREKWYVFKGELDAELAKRGLPPYSVQREQSISTEFVGGDASAVIDVEVDPEVEDQQSPSIEADTKIPDIIKLFTDRFVEKLTEAQQVNLQLQDELKEKERQIRLLPDLQRRAAEAEQALKEAETKELEAIALRKQIELLKKEEAKRERELSTLESRLHSLETVQTESQAAHIKASELEIQLENLKQRDEEKLRLAEQEIAQLRDDKDAQNLAIQAQIQQLTTTVQEFKKPWWKKMFSAPEN